MQRSKRSLLNAVTAVMLTLSNGLFGLVSIKFILTYFGSDFNGLNSTASQIITILMLLEGGFTVATNVALFKPFANKEYDNVSSIISATKNTFRKIGIVAFAVGIVIAGGYSFVINTNLPRFLVFSVFFMTILPVCFNFYYATKYRILLQAEQKEYIISFITLITSALGYITNIIAMPLGCNMWFVRFSTMFFAIINSLVIGFYVKKKFSNINYKAKPNYLAIKGTKDVFIQKLTGVFYSTAPIVCITLTAGGTALASVYAVYNSVFVLLKGIMNSIIDAPRLSLGELAAQNDRKTLWDVYEQYETIVLILLFSFLTTAAVMVMPFINIYTKGVTDVNYNQPVIAILLVFISCFELIHLPSGHLMNMTGQFKTSKRIQIIAMIIMLAGFIVTLIFNLGIYGVLSTVLLTAISLALMEIGFIHTRYFTKKFFKFNKICLPFLGFGILLVIVQLLITPKVNGYISFFALAIAIFIINGFFAILLSFICNKKSTKGIFQRVASFIPKKK